MVSLVWVEEEIDGRGVKVLDCVDGIRERINAKCRCKKKTLKAYKNINHLIIITVLPLLFIPSQTELNQLNFQPLLIKRRIFSK